MRATDFAFATASAVMGLFMVDRGELFDEAMKAGITKRIQQEVEERQQEKG